MKRLKAKTVQTSLLLGLFFTGAMLALQTGCGIPAHPPTTESDTAQIAGQYTAELTHAPEVPRRVSSYDKPEKVIVHMNVQEKVMRLADGVEYNFWTFGGTVPGPFIRVNEGDLVEVHLSNDPGNKMPHNIDFHAATGPGGGAEASLTLPGHTSVFSFRALNPGLFVYHCATAPVGLHIANGMYGMFLVEPRGGLPLVDREFYVMESEFYTKGVHGEPGLQEFDLQKAIKEEPEYVVFNGSVGALTGDKALQVKTGERVRIYIGSAGPNLTSSFHVIGEIFDKVYQEGGTNPNENVQTTLIPAGGAAMVEFTCEVPGTYTLVDHSIFRAFNQGAIAQLEAAGPDNKTIFSGKIRDELYQPGSSEVMLPLQGSAAAAPTSEKSFDTRMQAGQKLYLQNCSACHQPKGEGMLTTIPPLAKSDYLMNQPDKGIGILLHGINGETITVNGKQYRGLMPQLPLSDDEIASILTFVRNSWGNKDRVISAGEVAQQRAK